VAHLAGGVKEAVEIVGIVKGLLVVKEDIHRKSLSFFLSGCLNHVTLDSLDQDIHHLFADVIDVGKVLKDTAFQLFVLNGIKKLIYGVVVESLERKGCPIAKLLFEILLNQRLRD